MQYTCACELLKSLMHRSVNKNLLLIWQDFNVHVLPNLTAVMQAAVCSTEQKISANLPLTVRVNETLRECLSLQAHFYNDRDFICKRIKFLFFYKIGFDE